MRNFLERIKKSLFFRLNLLKTAIRIKIAKVIQKFTIDRITKTKSKFNFPVSIIFTAYIVNKELFEMTKRALESIKNNTSGYELIIVDNNSPLGQKYLKENADVYIRNNENKGFGPAVNQGLKTAKHNFIVIFCNDVEIHDKYWKQKLISVLQSDAKVGVVRPGLWEEKMWGVVEDHKNFGCFLCMMRKDIIQKLGYFDERFIPAYFEDIDYWHRLRLAGYKLFKNHNVKTTHAWGSTSKTMDFKKLFRINEQRFIEKWNMPHWRKMYL